MLFGWGRQRDILELRRPAVVFAPIALLELHEIVARDAAALRIQERGVAFKRLGLGSQSRRETRLGLLARGRARAVDDDRPAVGADAELETLLGEDVGVGPRRREQRGVARRTGGRAAEAAEHARGLVPAAGRLARVLLVVPAAAGGEPDAFARVDRVSG